MEAYIFELLLERVPRRFNCKLRQDSTFYMVTNTDYIDKIISLNKVSGEIFRLCDGKKKISEIIDSLRTMYPHIEYERIMDDVVKCIRELETMRLISVVDLFASRT